MARNAINEDIGRLLRARGVELNTGDEILDGSHRGNEYIASIFPNDTRVFVTGRNGSLYSRERDRGKGAGGSPTRPYILGKRSGSGPGGLQSCPQSLAIVMATRLPYFMSVH